MKKLVVLVLAVAMIVTVFAGCTAAPAASESPSAAASESAAAPSESAAEPSESAAAGGDAAIPEGVQGGKKIAVVRNLANGDHTQQFLAGCVTEGESFGFTVDTFVTDGDDAKLQQTVSQVLQKDYDGIIVSHGQLAYSYDMLKPAIDKGMVVSTFDTMPYKDGNADNELLAGVTSTSQDDQKLATLSLTDMIETTGKKPVKVLKTFMGPGIPPLDRRNEVYTKMESEGLIETVETIAPSDSANARGDMTVKTAAILPKYAEGSVDAIWGCYDELAKGVLQALKDVNRTDIPMFTIDISNDDINLMLENPDVWISTAAVDPKLIGIANMRLIALKLAGEETPDYYTLDAQLVKTTQLNDTITMENLNTVVDGWGTLEGISDLDTPWMDALRAEFAK
ncbi:MAG: sugar ABC transporter substrate-binding protein [Christensenella sp.]|uniref:sugar ABC transporter substrate-binding protein n=1 Tax=Christensenella sp. TaxID=1935934 RepID=UPI002B21B6DE|nr:sugar ABC transporter substrate-binding protein [Christensenella sp.]MEA5004066.1 sugar ABC transporter substrate-binding protein [Christensenella sp.]